MDKAFQISELYSNLRDLCPGQGLYSHDSSLPYRDIGLLSELSNSNWVYNSERASILMRMLSIDRPILILSKAQKHLCAAMWITAFGSEPQGDIWKQQE